MTIMDIKEYMQTVGRQARAASRRLAGATTAEKNAALLHIAAAIRREKAALVAANQEDLAAARAAGLETALLDRLTLSEKGVDSMAEGVEQVAVDGAGDIEAIVALESGDGRAGVDAFGFPPVDCRKRRRACGGGNGGN